MYRITFNENELPIRDLETIALAAGEQMLLNEDDFKSLLSGRRTGLQQLPTVVHQKRYMTRPAKTTHDSYPNEQCPVLLQFNPIQSSSKF